MPVILHYEIIEWKNKRDLEIKQFKTTEDLTNRRQRQVERTI